MNLFRQPARWYQAHVSPIARRLFADPVARLSVVRQILSGADRIVAPDGTVMIRGRSRHADDGCLDCLRIERGATGSEAS